MVPLRPGKRYRWWGLETTLTVTIQSTPTKMNTFLSKWVASTVGLHWEEEFRSKLGWGRSHSPIPKIRTEKMGVLEPYLGEEPVVLPEWVGTVSSHHSAGWERLKEPEKFKKCGKNNVNFWQAFQIIWGGPDPALVKGEEESDQYTGISEELFMFETVLNRQFHFTHLDDKHFSLAAIIFAPTFRWYLSP